MKNSEQSVPVGHTMTILIGAALAFALGQTAVVPAIGELSRNLGTSPQNVTWALTGYLVSAAVLTPVMGRLGDMFGKRRLLVAALVLFAAGGAVAALGGNLALVVIGRVIQGAGGGIFPLCFGIIRDEFPAARRFGAMGLISAVAGIGGGGGLLLGGLLIDHTSYQWIFWSGTLMALVAAVGAQVVVPESPVRTSGRIDLIGAGLLAVGVTLPLLAISRGSIWGWSSPRTISMIAGGLLVLVVLGFAERRIREPLIDMRILADPTVLVTNVATILVGFGMFGAFMLIPQLIQVPESSGYGFGGSATEAGLIMLPGSVMTLLAGPLSAMLTTRFGAKLPLVLGSVITGGGLVALAADHGSVGSVLGLGAVTFFGVGLSFAAMPALIISSVSAAQTGQATGVNTLLRSAGSSVGSQIVASVLAGSVVAGQAIPTEHAYVMAFLILAGVTLVAAVAAALIPRGKGTVPEEIVVVAPLREPGFVLNRR